MLYKVYGRQGGWQKINSFEYCFNCDKMFATSKEVK